MHLFVESLQILSTNVNPSVAKLQPLLNIEAISCILRTISRLLRILTDVNRYAGVLIDTNIIEFMSKLQQIPPDNKTGIEVRLNAVKMYACLSANPKMLEQRDLTQPVEFVFDCMNLTNRCSTTTINVGIASMQDIVVYGTGFLSNVVRYNIGVKVGQLFTFIECTSV